MKTDRAPLLLFFLASTLALEMMHRQLLALLIEPIGNEYHWSDSYRSILLSAHSFAYVIFSPLVARLADRCDKVRFIAGMIFIWSMATILVSQVSGFPELTALRAVLGMAGAGVAPAGLALLSQVYAERDQAKAMGLFNAGSPLGVLLCMLTMGWVATSYGWRDTFVLSGAIGILYGSIFFLATRGWFPKETVTVERSNFVESLKQILKTPAYVHLLLGTTWASAAFGPWLPTFFSRVHHRDMFETGVYAGLLGGFFGTLGIIVGGIVWSRLAKDRATSVLLPGLALFSAVPFMIAAYQSSGPHAAFMFLVYPALVSFSFVGPASAVIQNILPVNQKAFGAGLVSSSMALFGAVLAPIATGLLSEYFESPDESGIKMALSVMSITNAAACLHFLLAFISLKKVARREFISLKAETDKNHEYRALEEYN